MNLTYINSISEILKIKVRNYETKVLPASISLTNVPSSNCLLKKYGYSVIISPNCLAKFAVIAIVFYIYIKKSLTYEKNI